MTEADFWTLIDSTIDKSRLPVDKSAALKPLIRKLTDFNKESLEQFQELLVHVLYRLDGQKYLSAASAKHEQTSDGFLYARAYVVAAGRRYYEAVVADPSLMPKSYEEECENLLYVVEEAWHETHTDDWNYRTALSYETGSNLEAWD
ncbi:MAG TPA: DUF4240 domain-containing protein [Oculatellaceae cyanobacterium]